jgi:hypothetical protein
MIVVIFLYNECHFCGGMWRSLVAHFVRDEGAAGSNPVIPIVVLSLARLFDRVDKLVSVLPNYCPRCQIT